MDTQYLVGPYQKKIFDPQRKIVNFYLLDNQALSDPVYQKIVDHDKFRDLYRTHVKALEERLAEKQIVLDEFYQKSLLNYDSVSFMLKYHANGVLTLYAYKFLVDRLVIFDEWHIHGHHESQPPNGHNPESQLP